MECNLVWIIRMISNHKYDFRPKLHDTEFNYHFITSILKSLLKVCIGPQGWFVKIGIGNAFTCTCPQKRMTDVTLQKFIGAQRKQESTSCKCSSSSKSCYCKNSLLQSLILVVWLNNISPSLLLQLSLRHQAMWLRHRVFLGEKIESTAGAILRWRRTTSTRKSCHGRCHAVLKLWGTTWGKSRKTSCLKIRIKSHGLVLLTLLLDAIDRNQWCSFIVVAEKLPSRGGFLVSCETPSIVRRSVYNSSPLNTFQWHSHDFKEFWLVIISVTFFYFGLELTQDAVKLFRRHCFYVYIF